MKRGAVDFQVVTTRGGDRGESSLYNGERRRKDDFIFETVGDLDELNSALGVVRAAAPLPGVMKLQKLLLVVGAMAATPVDSREYALIPKLTADDVQRLEEDERELLERTEIRNSFICPGETLASAYTDVARTVARRCERRIVRLIREWERGDLIECQHFLNRLSDYLFILARFLEQNPDDEGWN